MITSRSLSVKMLVFERHITQNESMNDERQIIFF